MLLNNKGPISFEEALSRLEKYCAWQERSHLEAENKLRSLGVKQNDISEILSLLIQRGFLNEQRFASAYAGGKYRTLGWGRKKIIYQLRAKGINDKIIQEAIKEIPEDGYIDTLLKLISKKDQGIKVSDPHERRQKIIRFLATKGYEMELILEAVKMYFKK